MKRSRQTTKKEKDNPETLEEKKLGTEGRTENHSSYLPIDELPEDEVLV